MQCGGWLKSKSIPHHSETESTYIYLAGAQPGMRESFFRNHPWLPLSGPPDISFIPTHSLPLPPSSSIPWCGTRQPRGQPSLIRGPGPKVEAHAVGEHGDLPKNEHALGVGLAWQPPSKAKEKKGNYWRSKSQRQRENGKHTGGHKGGFGGVTWLELAPFSPLENKESCIWVRLCLLRAPSVPQ